MKNRISVMALPALLFFAQSAFGQVGVSTPDPKATLDVAAVPADLTKTDGIIAPRLTADQVKAKDNIYGAAQTGSIVYVTQALTTVLPTGAKSANLTAPGYYYFDGTIWQVLNTSVGIWNQKGTTNTVAHTSAENVWRGGSVAVGEDIGNSAVKFAVTNRITDGSTTNSSGIGAVEYSNGPGQKSAIYGLLEDTASSGTSVNLGMMSTVNDKSTTLSRGNAGLFSYSLIGSKDNSSSLITGVTSNLFLYSTGTLLAGNVYGTTSYAGGTAAAGSNNTGDISVNNLRGVDATAAPYTVSGHNFTSPMTIGGQMEVSLQGGGTSDLVSVYGANASINTTMAGGNLKVTNAMAALRSYTGFGSTGTYDVNKLYGLFVDVAETGSASKRLGNSYGIFISRYRFAGDTASNAYNLYSQGADTKNYFQGRVGVGINTPGAQLHIVKQATDLTPAIIAGCNEYTDNADAISNGLPQGALYRTGDVLKVVHP
ncbi:hypothetical protein [Chryseobacterium shigense]|uniref:Head domain of trimeric autotransporter adhesin n=1 Tax=Chryseobacterium shigense TaxID=297244 RepID=A0A841NDR3_9FLAO|nr:hypothetical protein [Chryseobacterium shigense]MBB6369489.1 hypothetical protein [Chryseobacterium shigense]